MNEYVTCIGDFAVLLMLIEAVLMWVMTSVMDDNEDKKFCRSIMKVILAFTGALLFTLLCMCTYSFFS